MGDFDKQPEAEILLQDWFSFERMSTFAQAGRNSEQLYVWNARVSKAYLVDIQHVEVAMRNAFDRALTKAYGANWFDYANHPQNFPINFQSPAKKSISKAIGRSGWNTGRAPGKVIAELPLDFWYFLLSASYSSSVWPKVQRELSTRMGREEFRSAVEVFYKFRNRAAHHEPLVRRSIEEEDEYLDSVSESIYSVANWIDPECAKWIEKYSTVKGLRNTRPE